MKKGIVIALAILMIFVLVGCGEKDFSTNENDSIDQQLIGTSWYQSQTTETDIGEGVLSGGEWGLYVENITLSIITTRQLSLADFLERNSLIVLTSSTFISADFFKLFNSSSDSASPSLIALITFLLSASI